MKQTNITYKLLLTAVKCGLYDEPKVINAIMNLKDNSKMTTTLYIFNDPSGKVVMNISKCTTYEFENEKEFTQYLNKKFTVFKSEKEMWQTATGMNDETWEEWNK